MISYCSLCSNISYVYNKRFIRKLFLTRVFNRNRPVWGTKKLHRNVKLHFNLNIMADPRIEEILAPLRAAVKEQGDYVKQLKANNAPELDIKKAVADLKTRKKILDNKELELAPASAVIDRAKVEDLLKRRFFYDQSFAIYGGVSGQYDFGPMGCALKTNIINTWRSFFILEEQMLEVDCSILTPEPVLKASGHVERFADLMVKDRVNGECFRLDHLIKASLEKIISDKKTTDETREECRDIIVKSHVNISIKYSGQSTGPSCAVTSGSHNGNISDLSYFTAKYFLIKCNLSNRNSSDTDAFRLIFHVAFYQKLDGMTKEEMQNIIYKFNIRSPTTGNPLSEPMDFNLMFSTQIGPTNLMKGFLRPETAQGIFVNFKRLLVFNQGKLPFAAAQIGNSFRNEISPRSGLIRVREFTMAEIEHFCDPRDKSHHKFSSVVDHSVILYSACNQMDGKPAEVMTIGEAVDKGLIANQTLGYFIARIHMFLVYIGIDKSRLRFRQHMSNEMAHYACDCWDAECLTSYGWIECVGCADRSAYDLTQHYKATGVKLVAEKHLPEPAVINIKEIVPNKPVMGKTFKQETTAILTKLRELDLSEICNVENILKDTGKYELLGDNEQKYELTADMISIKSIEKTVHVEEFVPNVIEPSFGIGRIMYALLEQNFHIRQEDEQRTYFSLPAVVAPIKCAVFPLGSNEVLQPFVKQIANDLLKNRISHKVDDASGSIGRRYTRMDEIAVPFGITVDFDSLSEPHTVTLRERDSTKQLRIPMNKVVQIVNELSNGELNWEMASSMYPKFEQQEATKVPSS